MLDSRPEPLILAPSLSSWHCNKGLKGEWGRGGEGGEDHSLAPRHAFLDNLPCRKLFVECINGQNGIIAQSKNAIAGFEIERQLQ